MYKILIALIISIFSLSAYCGNQTKNLNTKLIEQTVGLKGKFETNIDTFTVTMLEKDLPPQIVTIKIHPWAGFEINDEGKPIVFGDIVVMNSDVDKVLDALSNNKLTLMGIRWYEPDISHVYFKGKGDLESLAKSVRNIFGLICHSRVGGNSS